MMEKEPFRVLLDFSEVNAGISALKYVWMHVSPRELNTIQDLKQAITRNFSFSQEGFKLFLRDGLLLETEKIAILREDDVIKIHLEVPFDNTIENHVANSVTNVSVAPTSSHSFPSNVVSLSKSCKRKSDTFITSSKETEIDLSMISRSKKKKKKDQIECASQDSANFINAEEPSLSLSQDLSNVDKSPLCLTQDLSTVDKNLKSNKSTNNKSTKHGGKSKKRPFPKTPTSEFIAFAVKLSEAEKMDQSGPQTNVTTKDKKIMDGIADTDLLTVKTSKIVNKTNLSPIPELGTHELSQNETSLSVTENFDTEESFAGDQGLGFKEADKMKRKRKRKRKRKMTQHDDEMSLSVDISNELGESFLANVKTDATYNTSSEHNARKHIIFHSPSPPTVSETVTLDSGSASNFVDSKEFSVKNDGLKTDLNLDSSKNSSLNEDSVLDTKNYKGSKSVESEIEDFSTESTPFEKKKSKKKLWGITPLPRMSNRSHTFSVGNNDVPKAAYKDCTPLNCLPPVGTRLAYKTLELNEDYCPEVTEYKEGILRKIDPNTDELEIELIKEEIKPGRSGKFENVWNDQPIPDDQVIKMVSLNWSAIIDPRLIPY